MKINRTVENQFPVLLTNTYIKPLGRVKIVLRIVHLAGIIVTVINIAQNAMLDLSH